MRSTGAESLVVAGSPSKAGWSKGVASSGPSCPVNRLREEPVTQTKPFAISKQMVWDAYKAVKVNKGAPGVDGQTIEEFEEDLGNNLYRIWNRLSSGHVFPSTRSVGWRFQSEMVAYVHSASRLWEIG